MKIKKITKILFCFLCISVLIFSSGCFRFIKHPILTPDDYPDTWEDSSSSDDSYRYNHDTDKNTFVPETDSFHNPSGYYSDIPTHSDIPFDERSRDSFNKEAYDSYITEFQEMLKTSGNDDQLLYLYDEISGCLCDLETDAYLSLYDYYLDPSDEDNAEISATKEETFQEFYSDVCCLYRDALKTDYEALLRDYIGDELADSFTEVYDFTEEENSLFKKQTELEQKYDNLIQKGADEEKIKKLYIDIVKNNNDIAKYYGYDNYADYAYSEIYLRDYDIDDINRLSNEVLDEILPLYGAYIEYALNEGSLEKIYESNYDTGEEKFEKIRKYIGRIAPELSASMDYLMDLKLYDVDPDENKIPAGFTASLPAYNDAFIFYSPDSLVADYTTLVHEFGHFNHHYYVDSNIFYADSVMDVQEIMSQGLELLFCDYYPLVDRKNGQALVEYTIYNKLNSVLSGFAVNEAEYASYTTKDLTTDKLDEIWYTSFMKYGLITDENEFSWTDISHVFTSPMYYISYATSALASFEIYNEACNDRYSGIDKYMTISALSDSSTFIEALDAAGLDNVFEDGTVTKLADSLSRQLDIRYLFKIYKAYFKENNTLYTEFDETGDTERVA